MPFRPVPDCPTEAGDTLRREVRSALQRHSPPALARSFEVLEGSLAEHLQPGRGPLLAAEICFRVRASIDGHSGRALPIATLSTLCFLAFDLLDDLQDGDQRHWWGEHGQSELMLVAAALPSTVAVKLLAEAVPDPARFAAIARLFADGILEVAEGQARDLASVGAEHIGPEEAEETAGLKAGAQMALYARLTALHAGIAESEASAFAGIAHGMTCAGQIRSDVADLMDVSWSSDLAAGVRTVPIAFALHRSAPDVRQVLLGLLDSARTDREAQLEVRALLQSSGAIPYALIRSAVHKARAHKALNGLELGREDVEQWRRLIG